MQVKDIMSTNPRYITPETTLQEAAQEMLDHDIGFLPIGENDRLIGTVTDRDIAIRAVAQGNGVSDMKVRDIMTQKVMYCFEDDPVEKACESMCNLQLRRLIVLDNNKRITGILSTGDLAKNGHNDKLCGHVMHDICS